MKPPYARVRAFLAGIRGPDRNLDATVLTACGARVFRRPNAEPEMRWPGGTFPEPLPAITGSLNEARALVGRALPDFWISSGLCSLSGHASIGPDFNGPAGARLRQEWPEAQFHAGFDADLKPGDGQHRECAALLTCMLDALEQKPDGGAP